MKNNKSEPIPVMDYRQYRRVRRLVHECCNYIDGNCIALDDGEECVCVQSISYSLLCRWFRAAVLPQDKELETALFTPGSNRAKYCPECAARMKRINAAKSKDIRQVLTELYEVFDFCAVEEAAHYYENWQS
ncbi:cysteine-rich VLP domain-containing protein [Hominiventricola filiformis]|uniref:Cysteine-rich VLP domain-containing protein n=1 Tax=Hominiventricola filiformis TaxID=2885352 RepID=A0AAE3ABB6_9FIRM|nr:cysteine-rich VLP domain-containing protein [Hominiventricola filiformis]MCC2127887.1 cysteine-rich VLP domain-containing protein [Hominiventricola filiformis]